MTLDEQARAIWFTLMDGQVTQELAQRQRVEVKDIQIEIITTALRQQWEQAAKEIENTKAFVDSGCTLPCGSILADLIRWCRQRAKGKR